MKIYCKILIKYFIQLLLLPIRLLPLKQNRVTLLNDLGGYSDSPRCICEYLRRAHLQLEIFFACLPPLPEIEGVHFIKKNSFAFFIKALTSKVFLTNNGNISFMPFSQHTTVINTWHGGGTCKRIVPLRNRTLGVLWDRDMSAKKTQFFLSSCKIFTQGAIQDHLATQESILEIGLPKNDVFFAPTHVKKLREEARHELNIPPSSIFVLYAPTFRSSYRTEERRFLNINEVTLVIHAIEQRTKYNVIFGYRTHRLSNTHLSSGNYINLHDYPDIQKLLCAVDVLITDYSSIAWDFSFTNKPVFIYAPDIKQYESSIGFYMPSKEWPYPVATDIDSLLYNIQNIDISQYLAQVKKFHSLVSSYENGHASQRTAKLILSLLS